MALRIVILDIGAHDILCDCAISMKLQLPCPTCFPVDVVVLRYIHISVWWSFSG